MTDKRTWYGVFARPDHPKGWGLGEYAHGYVILIVFCRSESQLDAVSRTLAIVGLPEPSAHRDYQWFGGQMDHVATFKVGRPWETGRWKGVGVSINHRYASGDNRTVILRSDAGQLLREIGTLNAEIHKAMMPKGVMAARENAGKTRWPELSDDDKKFMDIYEMAVKNIPTSAGRLMFLSEFADRFME